MRINPVNMLNVGAGSPLAPLRHDTFRAIWSATQLSNFGTLIQGVGAAWLMTSIANSVDMVALVQAATTLPIMLFSLIGGAVADSFNRRTVIFGAQIFMFVVSVALAITAGFGLVTPWLLLAFTFLIGCGTALNNPAWQATVGDLVPRSDLPSAVALNSIGFNLSRSVGPALGGLIVAAAGAAGAFAVNASSYVALLFVLSRWKPKTEQRALPREAFGSAVLAGLRYVAMSPNIGKVLVRTFLFGFAGSSVLALLPVAAGTLLGGGPLVYGLLLGAFGVGAVGGALASGPMHRGLAAETIVRIAFVGSALCAGIVAIGVSPWLAALGLLMGGACWVLALSLFNVTVQMSTPRWVVGRALSIYQTATFGGMALGSWVWGVTADSYGIQMSLLTSGLVLLVGAAAGFVLPLPPRVALNLDPANRWRQPEIGLDIQGRSGPIAISIEYIIRPEDVPAFLSAMAERQRIRRRDGARNWVLARDLQQPEHWVETYHTPTWVDYVRHNQRLTQLDSAVGDRLAALHQGSERPKVRRMIERPTSWRASTAMPEIIEPH